MSSGLALETKEAHGGGWKRYPAYRDSGVAWLGAVPEGWEIMRTKYCSKINMGQSPSSEDCNIDCIGLPFLQGNAEFGAVSPAPNQYCGVARKVTHTGDLLISVRAPVGALNVADQDYGIGRGLCGITPNEINLNSAFCWHLLHYARVQLNLCATGSTYDAVSAADVGNMVLVIPPLPEQRTIAAFLDRETGRIDALIAKKERQIELLREKRAALISHAVTKGLDLDAPMKNSGVEWLGEVPEHWNILALRRVVSRFVDYRGKTPEKVDRGVPLITAKNIKDGHIDLSQSQEFMREDEYQDWMTRGWPEIGDVLITTEAPLGEVAQVEDTFIALAQRIILLKVNKSRIINDYLKYHFLSTSGQGELWTRASGSTALGIKAERFKGTLVSVPPLNEQQKITRYLDSGISRLERPSSKIRESISKLREYRTALISAAVTGKIDVREELVS
jgi:type I restriction enzyme S subunit